MMTMSKNPVTADFDTSQIFPKDNAEFFEWVRKNYGDAGAIQL